MSTQLPCGEPDPDRPFPWSISTSGNSIGFTLTPNNYVGDVWPTIAPPQPYYAQPEIVHHYWPCTCHTSGAALQILADRIAELEARIAELEGE